MKRSVRRSFVSLAVASLCAVAVLGEGAILANGNSGCDQTNPTADVSVSQTAAGVGSNIQTHVILTNLGPCNVADAALNLTLPADSSVVSISTTPNSWSCAATGKVVNCTPTATIGVPGNHDFFVLWTPPPAPYDPTTVAVATIGGGPSACTDGNAATTCDPFVDNNTSWGGFITAAGGSITGGGGSQTTQVTIPASHPGSAEIKQLGAACPPGFPSCFGRLVSIRSVSTGTDRQLRVFTYDASLVPVSFGQFTMIFNAGSGWNFTPRCRGNPLPDPCVLATDRFREGSTVFFQALVSTTLDDEWFGD